MIFSFGTIIIDTTCKVQITCRWFKYLYINPFRPFPIFISWGICALSHLKQSRKYKALKIDPGLKYFKVSSEDLDTSIANHFYYLIKKRYTYTFFIPLIKSKT